ncbi:MAG: hypothetical protein AAB701_02260 [Patescibacteria group bacterium]
MQFDLTRLPSMPHLPPVGHAARPVGKPRLLVYGIVAVVLLWLLLWSRAQSNRIRQQSTLDTAAFAVATAETFDAYLKAQPVAATVLTAKGLAVVEDNPTLGSAWLRSAAERDPKYRDGVLGAGFAELKLAESFWTTDAVRAQEHTEAAQHYLEAAQAIDPIYAYTYQLLALVYTNLGESERAAEATKKVTAFE